MRRRWVLDAQGGRTQVLEGYLDTRRPARRPARDSVLVRSVGPPPEAVRRWRLGEVDACLLEGGAVDVVPHRWTPPPETSAVTGVVLGHVIDGAVDVSQARRRARIARGETLFYDVGCPFGLHADGPHRYLVAQIPASALGFRPEDRARLVVRRLNGYSGASALGGLLAAIVDLVDPAPGTGQHLGDAIAACARAVIAEARGVVAGERSTALFGELIDWLDGHLVDSDATTEHLAAAHFLSARYVRKLFADHGTTVSAYVRRRRLERIRDELLQPWAADLPVSAVAARWGFRDPSVFSRAFTREFGQAPGGFRRASALGGAPAGE